jgi:RNA polymerase sigma-70 factor (ECF subfamily)
MRKAEPLRATDVTAPARMTLEADLAALRQPLLRFAQMQLRNTALAEDVVSETLLAVLEKPAAFEGRSSLRTYATGILKFKIIDVLRRSGREVALEAEDGESSDDVIDALFRADGHYVDPPRSWGRPDALLQQQQFIAALELCIERLPPRLARVFMAREWLELDTAEICAELGITPNHCGVLLFRARMQLRECLGRGWAERST